MTTENWVEAALTNDALVAELLLRLKHSSSSDSLHAPPPPTIATATTTPLLPSVWGHRKNRSKSTASTTTITNGFGKEQRGSPTTHLSWSGGGGSGSTSDGYDESSRPSDLSSGGRSIKANEGASTYDKSHKRKSFADLKDEEGSLLKERMDINKELTSMRASMNQQMVTSEKLKKIKMDLDQNPRNEMGRKVDDMHMEVKQSVCRVEAESEERGFVLPDLNMTPSEEDP